MSVRLAPLPVYVVADTAPLVLRIILPPPAVTVSLKVVVPNKDVDTSTLKSEEPSQ